MARPKAKSKEEKEAELQSMLAASKIDDHMADGGGGDAPAVSIESTAPLPAAPTSDEPTSEVEQKGENVSTVATPEPAASILPAEPEPASAPAPESVPAPTPIAEPSSTPGPVAENAPPLEVANIATAEAATEPTSEQSTTVEAAIDGETVNFDLNSLFVRSSEKKTFSMRIPDRHYQYLLMLGTIVGAGASPPDIIYNLVEQFIEKNDVQVQKAIQKQMRQRTKKP